jgi:hypothetical protein
MKRRPRGITWELGREGEAPTKEIEAEAPKGGQCCTSGEGRRSGAGCRGARVDPFIG